MTSWRWFTDKMVIKVYKVPPGLAALSGSYPRIHPGMVITADAKPN